MEQRLGLRVDDDEVGAVELGTAGDSPAVAGEPSSDGRNCGNVGFDAASTTSSTGPGPAATGTAVTPRVDALDRLALPSRTSPSHWKPGLSSRKPRSMIASTRCPDHAAGTSPGTGTTSCPTADPTRDGTGERRRPSSDGPASTLIGRRCGCTSGRTRSNDLAVDRSSTSWRSSCIGTVAHR